MVVSIIQRTFSLKFKTEVSWVKKNPTLLDWSFKTQIKTEFSLFFIAYKISISYLHFPIRSLRYGVLRYSGLQ